MENAPHLLVRCSLIYIYLTRNHTLVSCYPIGRGIVVFDFFSLLSFLFFFFPSAGLSTCLPPDRTIFALLLFSLLFFPSFILYDSSKIPSQPLNHSHLEILNYRIISRKRIQKLSNPIDYAYSSKDCSTVKKKKERKKETAMKVSNSTPPRCLEKGGKRGGHSLDSLEKVSGVREKEETHGEIGVRKGVERCCKTERGGGNGAEGGRESKEGLNGDGERGGEVRRGKTNEGIYRLIDSRGFVPPSLPFPILPPFVLLSLSSPPS